MSTFNLQKKSLVTAHTLHHLNVALFLLRIFNITGCYWHLISLSGDITQKGYEKKRAKLLGPYLSRGENRAVFRILILTMYSKRQPTNCPNGDTVICTNSVANRVVVKGCNPQHLLWLSMLDGAWRLLEDLSVVNTRVLTVKQQVTQNLMTALNRMWP